MSKVSDQEEREVFEKIHENYNHLNRMMVEEQELASKHSSITGNYREQMWVKFFRSIIPKKFAMAQGVMIIDSYGKISKEVDIAVYDEQYTPYVFQYNTLKFIPIEAVAVVIECKSTTPKPSDLELWVKSIDKLRPKASGIARIVSGYACGITNKSQIKTRPVKILATLKANEKDETIEAYKKRWNGCFDFIIQEQRDGAKEKEFIVMVPNEGESLGWWAAELNGTKKGEHLKIEYLQNENKEKRDEYAELNFTDATHIKNTLEDLKLEGNPLLTLNFQLNQLLMLLNNPMLFPHFAYAKQFQKMIHGLSDNEKCE